MNIQAYFRRRTRIHWPITLSASLMTLNVTLMVCWIVLLAGWNRWAALTIGVIAFSLILVGLSFWLVLTLKEIRLNHRQANFVDSVTHELKSPIAALQLYLETLKLRTLDESRRAEFHEVMAAELTRLDRLISQLLEVGKLDDLGANDLPEDISLPELIARCADQACARYRVDPAATFEVNAPPLRLRARRIVVELVLNNLFENAVKYGGDPPRVEIAVSALGTSRVRLSIANNGQGIAVADRSKIFHIFYRGGSELERRKKGTGLGLYIVQTLVKRMHGKISVHDRPDRQPGAVFVLELPGRIDSERDERREAHACLPAPRIVTSEQPAVSAPSAGH
jgi:signal transduction histidine kinase